MKGNPCSPTLRAGHRQQGMRTHSESMVMASAAHPPQTASKTRILRRVQAVILCSSLICRRISSGIALRHALSNWLAVAVPSVATSNEEGVQ